MNLAGRTFTYINLRVQLLLAGLVMYGLHRDSLINESHAILYSAEHPKRDMFVGFQAKSLAVLGGMAPRLTDKLMEIWAFFSQQSDRPSRDREDNALYRAGYGMHERGTHQGWIRSGSLYVKAEKHPLFTAAIIASFGVAIWLFAISAIQS